MKKFLLALAALSFSLSAFAAGDDDAFYGKIEKMPSAQNPTWVIGGKAFKADAVPRLKAMAVTSSMSAPASKLKVILTTAVNFMFPRWKSRTKAAAKNNLLTTESAFLFD